MKKRFETGTLLIAVMFLCLSLCACGRETESTLTGLWGNEFFIQISAPSDRTNTIAQGRHFKVWGEISGTISDDAVVRVSLYDAAGNEVRYAQANRKGTENVDLSWYKGQVLALSESANAEDVLYTMPELVNPPAESGKTCHDATLKCLYTDDTFYALITAATDPSHGLAAEDYLNLTDENGNPYAALEEGSYQLVVTVTENGGLIGRADQSINIGTAQGTMVLRGGNNRANYMMTEWAESHGYTVLRDLLPGMFGFYELTAIPVSYMCEKAEYESGKIVVMDYNITESSTSYGLELSNFVQKAQIADTDQVEYYVFDIGEPEISGQDAGFVKVEGSKLYLCRKDVVPNGTKEGVFHTDQSEILSSTFGINDSGAISVSQEEKFALMGVTLPYQLQEEEVEKDPDRGNFCIYHNGVSFLEYTFCSQDGKQKKFRKEIGLKRFAEDGQTVLGDSLFEFYHVFDAGRLGPGQYQVTVAGYDRKKKAIPDMETEFTLTIE